jgi:hypothetical protein
MIRKHGTAVNPILAKTHPVSLDKWIIMAYKTKKWVLA